jgi:hypothetical protein
LFASAKMLFYGYSLSDGYLNELRSETLAMLQPRGKEPIVTAYHLNRWDREKSSATTRAELEYKRRHEGLCVIPVRDSFQKPFRALIEATSSQCRFARTFFGKRILAFERPHSYVLPRSGFEESALTLCALAYAPSSAAGGCDGDGDNGNVSCTAQCPSPTKRRRLRPDGPATNRNSFRAATARFLRARNDYNAILSALGPERARPRQVLPLPDRGAICITFNSDDFSAAAAELTAWDAILVADDCIDVLCKLRASQPGLRFPAIGYNARVSAADKKATSRGLSPDAAEALLEKRARTRGLGLVDYAPDRDKSVFAALHELLSREHADHQQ